MQINKKLKLFDAVVTLDNTSNEKSNNVRTAKLKYEQPVISNRMSVNNLTQGGGPTILESVDGGAFNS